MPIHPVVHTLLWIAALACMFYPIVPMIRYNLESSRKQNERWAELEETIRKINTDSKERKAKQH